ncbi:MAG: glycosyltransferase family 39 protein [Dehalococcoidales bacterium]
MRLPKILIKIRTKEVLVFSLIILLAIGIRVGITYNTLGVPEYSGMAVDIGEAARNLAEGRGYVVDSAYMGAISRLQAEKNMLVDLQDVPPPVVEVFSPYYALPPGPSALLALTYKVFGEYRYIYFRLLEAIISSFGCLFIFLLGKELFNRNIGLFAALVYAVYLPLAYISTWALHDALIPFITLLAVYLFILGAKRKALKFYILAGLTTGIGCYFQPTVVLLPLSFGLGLFIYRLGESNLRKNITHVIMTSAVMMVVVVLVVSPWVARNYHITGKIMLMRPSTWQAVWEGFGEFENPVGAVLNDEVTYEQVKDELGYNIPYGTPEYDAVLRGKSIKAIEEHPFWWLSILARRAPHTIVYGSELGIAHYPRDTHGNILWGETQAQADSHSRFIIAIKSANFGEAWEILRTHPYAIFSSGMTLLFAFLPLLLSIIGIWLMRREWRAIVLVATVLFYFSVVNILFFVNWKTLVPGALAYVLFSAITLHYVVLRLKIVHE